MKKTTAFALSLCIISGTVPAFRASFSNAAITVSAEESDYALYEDNYLEYRVYSDHAELCGYSILSDDGNIIVPDEVIGVPVTRIASYAFAGGGPVNTMTISDNVTSISNDAFSGLEFLTSVRLPQGLTSIPDHAFEGCISLTDIEIPDSVTKIGVEAFRRCESLKNIKIPSGVETISYGAFSCCSALESIRLPESVLWIDHNAFDSCTSLVSINIPEAVTVIYRETFRECKSLVSVKLPSGIRQISELAFYGCSSLTHMTIPESVTSIGQSAFAYCSALEEINIRNAECAIFDDASTISGRYSRTGTSTGDSSGYSYFYDGIIRGYEDSTAQEYAEKYGYTFVPIYTGEFVSGDANLDGELSVADATFIMQTLANPDECSFAGTNEWEKYLLCADVTGDGDGVTSADALSIQKYLAGIAPLSSGGQE